MNKKFLYISIAFIFVALSVLAYTLIKLNQQSIVENKVLSLIPSNPELLVQFKNPDELYNKYIQQNDLFKKLTFHQKKTFIQLLKKTDSLYRLAVQHSIHIQDYSFLYAQYSNNSYIFSFAAERTKDIQSLKKFLQALKLTYTEKNGNFIISNSSSITTTLNSSTHLSEWFNMFSKTPSVLNIYMNKDTVETAFQVNFQGNEIICNGFVFYKNLNDYAQHPGISIPSNPFNYLEIKKFHPVFPHFDNEIIQDFYTEFQQQHLSKKIQVNNNTIYPLNNTDVLTEKLKIIADSIVQKENITVYKIKKEIAPYLKTLYPALPDSILYVTLNQNNLILSNTIDESISENKKIFQENFSNFPYYLIIIKNTYPETIEKSDYSKYFPFTIQFDETNHYVYDFSCEIYSALSKKYFSLILKIKQNTLNNEYLWAYSHTYSISKIAGIFDDHKTKTNFILIQDSLNNLICLSPNAEKLWSHPLTSPIKSNIFIVDILKNNKHQILFNTQDAVYLIDRNGNNVGRFPIKFISKISNPVNVFDYDNNKNYRIWFSTQNHYTYNYTSDGVLAQQYRPYYFEKTITHPPLYFSTGLSDYIVLISNDGSVSGISRKGEGRIALKNKLPDLFFDMHLDISNTLHNSYIYYCSPNHLSRISFSDERKLTREFKDTILDAKFFKHIFNYTLLATLSNKTLKLYSLKGDEQISITTDTTYTQLNIQQTPSGIYFILSHQNNHSIIKYNVDNTLQFIQKNLHSTALPCISHLFNDNQPYLIYVQNNLLCIKKVF